MVNPTLVATIYVNPVTGNDANAGSRLSPYRSITRALQVAKSAVIRLAVGTYNDKGGEKFPLVIPQGVIVIGNEATLGQGIVITGSGEYNSPSFGAQNITLLLLADATLSGVTVTNNANKGTGVWIESSNPSITNCTFINCSREGMFVSGTAKPSIAGNNFVQNSAGGLVIARNSKGEVLRNTFQKNGLGLAISDFSAPLVASNKFIDNKTGIALSREARPVLRNNLVENNSQGGLLVNGNAMPDLGSSQDQAANIFRGNGEFDIQNATSTTLLTAGNQVNPVQVKGLVEFVAAISDNVNTGGNNIPDTSGHWAAPFIELLVTKGLITSLPSGNFEPNAPINRAQYAALIAKAFNIQSKNQIPNFTDIQRNFWAAPAIAAATNMGFINGFPDGTFRPAQNLTKIQAIVSMVNGLSLGGGNSNLLMTYTDRAQIPSYATSAVAIATQNLLVVNYPEIDKIQPMRDITYAEVAALICQGLLTQGNLKPIASPYIVMPVTDIASFSDLTGHWAEDFIRPLVSMNLMNGFSDGTYRPDKPITRVQYAALVAAAFNPVARRAVPEFLDVPQDFWGYSAIKIAASGGFVSGFSDGSFRPNQNVQRLQVIVSLVSGIRNQSVNRGNLGLYSDIDTVPNSARAAVATATANNIVVNYPSIKQIQPNREATRGEVAAMVYQALVALNRVPKINSPYIVS